MSGEFFESEPKIINVGVDTFQTALENKSVENMAVNWHPPRPQAADLLDALADSHATIAEANQKAVTRMLDAEAVWRDVSTALDTIPGVGEQTILHAGPPVNWERMSGPQRGAVIGALRYEGLADSPEEARERVASGEVNFQPCHECSAVGPMAGVISPSMPVAVVENTVHGNVAYSNLNEGLGEVLRFGAYGDDVLDRLDWMEETLGPFLASVLEEIGGINLSRISSKALQMGDEIHNRNVAATSLLVRELAPIMASIGGPDASTVLSFLEDNDHFFLNLSMGACKVAADAASAVPWSTVVTAMARNGTDFGIRVSGLEDTWFVTDAPTVDGLYFPEYDEADANPDIGDSSIAETIGVGGFAMAGSPSITNFVGGEPADARRYTREMYHITVEENTNYTLPGLNFRGTPTGIDILRVLETDIVPIINTGIAHQEPGVGQIGAGVGRAPMECFMDACKAFCVTYQNEDPDQ